MREQELDDHLNKLHQDAVALLCGNIELLCANLFKLALQSSIVSSVLYSKSLCKAFICVCAQMATLEKAEGLLEELRGASYDAAVKDMEELKAFAAENVRSLHWLH